MHSSLVLNRILPFSGNTQLPDEKLRTQISCFLDVCGIKVSPRVYNTPLVSPTFHFYSIQFFGKYRVGYLNVD